MFRSWLAVSLATLVVALPAAAHGPTRQKVTESVTIAAPADVVWARIKNFDALKDWHPAVARQGPVVGNHPAARFLSAPARCRRRAHLASSFAFRLARPVW